VNHSIRFAKYEGLGNDFIVVDVAPDALLPRELITQLCDRRFGIGADGVLHVLRGEGTEQRARMVVCNADGSRPEMCGNGLRCVALHLARVDGLRRARFIVGTDAGPRECDVELGDAGAQVSTGLGTATVLSNQEFSFDNSAYELQRISMGNPHAVTFAGSWDEAWLDRFGAAVSASTPGGTNVEIVSIEHPRHYRVLVWERGVGRTLACGTGAGAVGVAATIAGRAPFDEPLQITLPGGDLEVTVARADLRVTLRGPARLVFTGEAELT
jgi:diaminopimelate epimerase